jgi:hypothetical protein
MERSLTLESIAQKSINYLERLVDDDRLPYFDFFSTHPVGE